MAQQTKKKSTTKKTSSKKKAKKSKIYIPTNNVLALCAIIIGVCTALLIVSTVNSTGRKIGEKPDNTTSVSVQKEQNKVQQKQSSSHSAEQTKTEQKKVQNKTQTTSQNATQSLPQKESSSTTQTLQQKTPQNTSQNNTQTAKQNKTEVQSEQKTSQYVASLPSSSVSEPKPPAPQKNIPDFPKAQNGATLVIIFDDGGHNMAQLEKCVTLPFPVTVAVLPKLTHSVQAASRVRQSGNEVILHQPMQAVNLNVNPGLGAITPNMDEEEVKRTLFENINEISPISGMNNHEGSLITSDAEKMSYVMKTASDAGIYFLDSRTNSQTKVPYVAQALGYSYYERNIFLDNTKTRENILTELQKGLEIANKKGTAIMIGHVWSAEILPSVLLEVYPELVKKGYKFSTVSKSNALITP